jgi:hypothetical protein
MPAQTSRWVDRTSRATRTPEQALSLLRSWPGGPNVATPMRFIDRKAYEDLVGNRELNGLIDAAPTVQVPIAPLVAIQHTINASRVAEYIRTPKLRRRGLRDPYHGGLIDLPIVIQLRGTRYIHDGHHRTVASKLLGARLETVRFVDLDKEGVG